MKPLIIDIDKLEDFVKIAKLARTVIFVDVQHELQDVLFLVPSEARFPAIYSHHAPESKDPERGWRKALADMWVIEATLED